MEEIDFGRMDFDYATLDENVRQRVVEEEDDAKNKCQCRSLHFKGIHDSDDACLDALLSMIRKRYDAGYTWCDTSFLRFKDERNIDRFHMFHENGLYFVKPRGEMIYDNPSVMRKWRFNSSTIEKAIAEVQVLGLTHARINKKMERIDFHCPSKKQILDEESLESCCKWIPTIFLCLLCIILFSLFIVEAGKNTSLPDCREIEAHTFCRGSLNHTSKPFPCRLVDLKHFMYMVNLSKH